MKSILLRRWAINSIIVFVVFFLLIGYTFLGETIGYAKGNSYAAAHLLKEFKHDILISLLYSITGTLTLGQPIFWVAELLRRLHVITFNVSGFAQFIVIPIITLVFSMLVILLTLPLWFKIPF